MSWKGVKRCSAWAAGLLGLALVAAPIALMLPECNTNRALIINDLFFPVDVTLATRNGLTSHVVWSGEADPIMITTAKFDARGYEGEFVMTVRREGESPASYVSGIGRAEAFDGAIHLFLVRDSQVLYVRLADSPLHVLLSGMDIDRVSEKPHWDYLYYAWHLRRLGIALGRQYMSCLDLAIVEQFGWD